MHNGKTHWLKTTKLYCTIKFQKCLITKLGYTLVQHNNKNQSFTELHKCAMEDIGNKRVQTRMKIKALLSYRIARMCKGRYWKQMVQTKTESKAQ